MLGLLKYTIFIAALLLCGCGDRALELPGQRYAVELVWENLYGIPQKAPKIYWKMGITLDCADGDGFLARHNIVGQQLDLCVSGVFWREINSAEVAYPRHHPKLSETSLSHELLHAALYLTVQNSDPGHTYPFWGEKYGFDHGLLDKAKELLADHGL